MEMENEIDGIVKKILKRKYTEEDIKKLTKEQLIQVILSIGQRQNILQFHYLVYSQIVKENNETEIVDAINVLNCYRNVHYNESSATDEYTLVQAINIILPEYNRLNDCMKDIKYNNKKIIEQLKEILEMIHSDNEIEGKYCLHPLTKGYLKVIENDIQDIINKYEIISKYTNQELANLKVCYESPTNEFKHLSFEEYIKDAEEANVINELLED